MFRVIKQIRELIDYLNYHTKCYDEGHPEITDAEWDKKYFELQDLENKYKLFFNNSPTQSISYEVVTSLEKVRHNHEMLSLDKIKSLEELKNFIGNKYYLAMCKMDGLTCSLKYVDGYLVSAETRGDGKIGDNILHNAKVIPSIPKRIPITETLIIDGEIICTKEDFKEFEEDYANTRSFAAGSMGLFDSKECSKRKLRFVVWDVIKGLDNEKYLSNKLTYLENIGFITVPFISLGDYEKDIDILTNRAEEKSYPIDGIVFKFDDIEYGKSLGKTKHHFKNAIAFKFIDDTVKSNLIGIDWTMGRTGQITPVAVFNEVELEGSVISRASLHNLSVLWSVLGEKPYLNQEVEVYRANMIIPQIKSAIPFEECENEFIGFINIPTVCPVCGEPTSQITDITSTFLVCNNPACEGKLINKLEYFVGKKGLDIRGLSKATLEKLINWKWVNSPSDLFELKKYRAEWVKMPGFGIKSVDNILKAIEESKNCELSSFITSLGIPLIGTAMAKELTKIFLSWTDFINAINSNYHFWEISGFGIEMHKAIVNFDYTEANLIVEKYLNIKNTRNEITDISLENLTFVITGKLNKFKNREELKSIIESYGGKVVNSISSKTNYLINNDITSTSSKNLSAKKLNIPIITEEQFIETFNIL